MLSSQHKPLHEKKSEFTAVPSIACDIKKIKERHPAALLIAVKRLYGKKEENLDVAYQIFSEALKQKNVNALYELGRALDECTTEQYSPKEALNWLKAAGEAGHADACALVGRIYAQGRVNVEISNTDACNWLNTAIDKGADQQGEIHLLLATVYDRSHSKEKAFNEVAKAAEKNNSRAHVELWRRLYCGIGVSADAKAAEEHLRKAAVEKKRFDTNPSMLFAKALLSRLTNPALEPISQERASTLFPFYIDHVEGVELSSSKHRTIRCSLNGDKVNLDIPSTEYKLEHINQDLENCFTPSDKDKIIDIDEHNLGILLGFDENDPESGYPESAPYALIKPRIEEPVVKATSKIKTSEEVPSVLIVSVGHHTNNWLAVIGDIDKITPILNEHFRRNWNNDILIRNSALEFLTQRLHLALGKITNGNLYVGKIAIGCNCWMYVILGRPTAMLRPEIHSAFPVVVTKNLKYTLKVKQILELHNRIEAIMVSETISAIDENKQIQNAKIMIPFFGIDFVSKNEIYVGKESIEVFLGAFAHFMVRNPHESLHLPGVIPSTEPFANEIDDQGDEQKMDMRTRSVVPGLVGAGGKLLPWESIKNFTGIIPAEGPHKENHSVAYIQGECKKTIQLNGTIFGKSGYLVTVDVGGMDIDVFCLLKHMFDGKATIVPGDYMSIDAGSIPQPGDLVYCRAWIQGKIAEGFDPVATKGTVVEYEAERAPRPWKAGLFAKKREPEIIEGLDSSAERKSSATSTAASTTIHPAAASQSALLANAMLSGTRRPIQASDITAAVASNSGATPTHPVAANGGELSSSLFTFASDGTVKEIRVGGPR